MLLLHVENTKSPFPQIQKVPSHTLPPLGRLTPSDDGASRRRNFDSYENTDFWAKILIFRCKNTENGKSNLAALVVCTQEQLIHQDLGSSWYFAELFVCQDNCTY